MKLTLVVLGLLALSGCTQNQMARKFGGNAIETLKPGQKLVTMTWKEADMWILTRPMRDGETAETYTFNESSAFGIIQGSVTIKEVR